MAKPRTQSQQSGDSKQKPAKMTKEQRDAYRREAFVRLGEQRLAAFAKRGKQIVNLASYPHTPRQREKVYDILKTITSEVLGAFSEVETVKADAISLADN